MTAPSVDIRTHPQFEKRWNIIQTGCGLAMAAIVIAACAGLLGAGPLAHERVPVAGGVLAYDRVARYKTPLRYILEYGTARRVTVNVERSLALAMDLSDATPRPLSIATGADGLTYSFDGGPGGHIEFKLQPRSLGWVSGRVAVNGQSIRVAHLVVP